MKAFNKKRKPKHTTKAQRNCFGMPYHLEVKATSPGSKNERYSCTFIKSN